MAEELSGLRKSAIVLLSLGQQQATELLRRMPEETAVRVREEMAKVGALRGVSLRTRQRVLSQFCADATPPTPPPPAVNRLPAAPPKVGNEAAAPLHAK